MEGKLEHSLAKLTILVVKVAVTTRDIYTKRREETQTTSLERNKEGRTMR